jgi:hypothetical protein
MHSPFTRTIDEIWRDLQILKEIGVEQVVLSYHFLPEGKDVEKIIHISKELSLFADRYTNSKYGLVGMYFILNGIQLI